MILKVHRLMWSLQWFIFLLCHGVSYSPTTIRRGYRNSVDVIPLRFSSSGFHSSKIEIERSHPGRVIDSAINVCHLRQISQSQVWDPGLSSLDFGNGGVTIRADLNKRSWLLLYLLIMGLYLSVWKRTTKFGEVDIFSFRVVALVNDPISSNGVSEKKTNIPDATSPYAEHISKRTKDFTSYGNRRVVEPHILQERHQLWGRRQWIFQYPNMSSEVGVFYFSVLMLVDDVISKRIKGLNQQQAGDYSTNTIIHISFFRRVPKSLVLRCNGWIADLAFRKRKRWYIDKKQMFPKLESHSRLTDKTRATKHIFRIAAPKLLCFFVIEIFVCIYIPMCNITIFGSY